MPRLSRLFVIHASILLFLFVVVRTNAQKLAPLPNFQPEWVRDYPPFRIAGNFFYVGTYDLASYLITTPAGDVLINTGLPGSDTIIRRHIEALGFRFKDIKILLATHAHFDHVGAMAAIRRQTKAKLMIEAGDAPVLADGGNYRVLIANIPTILDSTRFPGMPAYPDVMKDYAYTLDAMPKLKFDLWFASHASQFELQKKHHPGDPYNPMAFADRAGYDAAISEQQKAFSTRVSALSQ
jgi:metallo-beta-lactamase class B